MHLLLAQKGAIHEGDEAIDLGQSPGDIVFLSAADTELASLAEACSGRDKSAPSLRLANLMQLSHPMSVDVYAEKTLSAAKIIIVRVLGGESYWAYGLEKLYETALDNDIQLVVLPGDDKPDPGLERFNTVDIELVQKFWAYLLEGGPQNARSFLALADHCLGQGEIPSDPVPLLKAGVWWPKKGICGLDDLPWQDGRPVVAISFYRALVQSGGLGAIEALIDALEKRGMNVLPVFISSLKDPVSVATLRELFSKCSPPLVLNATGFAVSSMNTKHSGTVLDEDDRVVLQVVLSSSSKEAWEASSQGLTSRDLAMNIALPEVDGRVFARAIAFKSAGTFNSDVEASLVAHEAEPTRITFAADMAVNWVNLRTTKPNERKVAIILANYPNRDGRLGNGVGLDTPAGTLNVLNTLNAQGYEAGEYPSDGDALITYLQDGPTNAATDGRVIRETISLNQYRRFFQSLPEEIQNQITDRWGEPEADPFFLAGDDALALPLAKFGNVVVGIQPARGYNIDPKETYHSPDLVPPHGYLAFYGWLRGEFGAHAFVHMGKHGNLEWLPGKALSLSETCFPEAVFGPVPHLYPFIVNDPGEGTQAKRRTSAVIIDHLTPPLTRAESYGPLRDLEALVDEYYEASGVDPRRLVLLKKQILELISDIGLDEDAGISDDESADSKLEKLDAYLCDLKEMQIRDGLHIFGEAPEGRLLTDLIVALTRVPREQGEGKDQSLQRALSKDLLGEGAFDPLDCEMEKPWDLAKPEALQRVSDDLWRSNGDTVERIELLAGTLVSKDCDVEPDWVNTIAVLDHINETVRPDVEACGHLELAGLTGGLDGRFVAPGSSGAPTRGRLDVLPTGRNFYSVDSRSVPTPAAWELGRKSAELLVIRFRQDNGEWPTSFGLSAWGTSNMRTGGDDIAQALALIGTKPVWDHASRRVTGYEIITLAELGRPRVDVTLRISGFFRDAFPAQIELYDRAIRAVGALDEPGADNPIAQRMNEARAKHIADGIDEQEAERRAGYRIFGSKPGAYGAGLQALIDEKGWDRRADLAEAYLAWGGYAYGAQEEGSEQRESFKERLAGVEAVIHNQDNREHDLLDSDDYYQFEGGMTAAVEQASGSMPRVYHNDHSRPEKPVIRALEEEIARVVRARVINPKWIAGVMRHGYKGAFEMAATLDYLFAFSATTGAVRNHHFELVYEAYLANEDVLNFLKDKNPHALKEMAERFLEAEERGLWTPRSNSAKFQLQALTE